MTTFTQAEVISIEYASFAKISNLGGKGGALSIERCIGIISHCSISECVAEHGGAIHANNSDTSVTFSVLVSNRCTVFIGDENLGGNAICASSGKAFSADYLSISRCSPSPIDRGESVIVTHTMRNQVSYLNITECNSRNGGFISIRSPDFNSSLKYINAVESSEYSMIEHDIKTGLLYFSNFVKNTLSKWMLSFYIICEECVFIKNSRPSDDPGIIFRNCHGEFPGSTDSADSITTIQFPKYNFRISDKKRYQIYGIVFHLGFTASQLSCSFVLESELWLIRIPNV